MNPTEDSGEPEMAELPKSWKALESGAPAPNWVAAVDEARRDIDLALEDDKPGRAGNDDPRE
ncbi:MAG TPA: hypothetical protein VFS54_00855 [Solirubrobacterales bacterium]|nr:hypothetical protein [Solirubrobacterales bacterium]